MTDAKAPTQAGAVTLNPFGNVARASWREKVDKDLRGRAFESLARPDVDGLPRQVLYTLEDAPAAQPSPGVFPFGRGGVVEGRACKIAPRISVADTDDLAGAVQAALSFGAELVWLEAGDDADALGRALALCSREPAAEVLVDADAPGLAGTQTHTPIAGTESISLDLLAPVYAGRADLLSLERLAVGESLVLDLRPVHECGGSPVEVLAGTLGAGVAALRAAEATGRSLESVAQVIMFSFAAELHFFDAVATLRAARSLWAQLLAQCGVPHTDCDMAMRVDTGLRDLSDLDPWINALRVTTSSFAAQVAGADWIGSANFDTQAQRAELAGRLSVNTPLVLREESHAAVVADPTGGSHMVEARTEQLRQAAWELFQADEAAGGWLKLLADGAIAGRIEGAQRVRANALATGRMVRVGVSRFPDVFDAEARAPRARDYARLTPVRTGAPFEALRRRAAKHGAPKLALMTLGPLRDHKARADFARDLFAAGGVEVVEASEGEVDALGVLVVGTDAAYAEHAQSIAERKEGTKFLAVVARPPKAGDPLEALSAHVDAFAHMRVDAIALCEQVHALRGDAVKGGAM